MKPYYIKGNESAVSTLIEYIIISGVLMVLLIIMLLVVNSTLMQGPADQLRYSSFVDIGNGISTRIVDVYVLAPYIGSINSKFTIPDDVAGTGYLVDIANVNSGEDEQVVVSRSSISSRIALAGIGASLPVGGNTTGSGMKLISYSSSGF